MSALLIGFLVVVGSAALFGAALFGRRPIPQSAIAGVPSGRATTSEDDRARPQTRPLRPVPVAPAPIPLKAADVRLPAARRIRSGVLLAVSALGMALLVGAVLSIVVIVLVFLVA
ncbi:MAG: hypothetical protein ACK5O2_00090 [Microthrixaceae bacterium]